MNKTLVTSMVTAGVASLCCTGPALRLIAGSTVFEAFSFLEPIRLYASILALSLLGFAILKSEMPLIDSQMRRVLCI